MKIKVNFEELDEVKNEMDKNTTDLDYQIQRMLDSLERLKHIWYGVAMDKFYDNAHNYIERMKVLTSFMGTTSSFVGNCSKRYFEQDESFSESLKREVIVDESRNKYDEIK